MAETKVINNNSTVSNGIGFFGLLAVLFIGLKLTGYINWSWALVLLPLYWFPALILVVLAVLAFLYGIVKIAETISGGIREGLNRSANKR